MGLPIRLDHAPSHFRPKSRRQTPNKKSARRKLADRAEPTQLHPRELVAAEFSVGIEPSHDSGKRRNWHVVSEVLRSSRVNLAEVRPVSAHGLDCGASVSDRREHAQAIKDDARAEHTSFDCASFEYPHYPSVGHTHQLR
jgi:hypothetical protein